MKEILVPRVMVAIPTYNEETAIGSVVLKAMKHADEVVVETEKETPEESAERILGKLQESKYV